MKLLPIRLWINLTLGLFMTLNAYAEHAPITKSANDTRDYAYTTLANGLQLLVISDPEAQRAAVAVDVDAGTSAEPDDFPGLAHFLEHMLFLGTDKYPDPDDYINYISDHGGNHNAFTAFDHTNYFFDIDPGYLHEGLQRFSRFFVAPLMAEKYVERERNAVDSEYQSKLREDGWRGMDTLKQAVNPKHPYARFSIGNNATLPKETVRPALLKFYKKYYSADRMTAVIIGREPTKTLTNWGVALFADVPKRPSTDLNIKAKLFDGVNLPIEIRSESVQDEKNLSVYFQFPYSLDNEYHKSLGYLSFILGYEGEGSLLAALKKQSYASELYSGSGYRIGDETSFEIGVQLTDKGYANTDNVLALIFAYIDRLKADKAGEKRYQEIATVSKTAFQFKEKRNAIHEVSELATRLNRFPAKDVQALNAIFKGYDKTQIDTYLAQMTAQHAVIQITAPDIKSPRKTQYFHVPYAIKPLNTATITAIAAADKGVAADMHLPKPNPFIADNYALNTDKIGEQHTMLDNGVELYFKNDTSFRVPRSSVQISLQPTGELALKDKTALTLLAALIDEQLSTTLYDASIAGMQAEIAAGERSLAISLEGYQQKMAALLTVILKQIQSITIEPTTFERVKSDYRQDLVNTATKMPYQQTFPYLNAALVIDASLPAQRLAVLDALDEKALVAFAEKTLSSLAVRMMVYGNDSYADAKALGETIGHVLKNTQLKNTWQPNQAKALKDSATQTFDDSHADSTITYYIQANKGYSARADIGLLAKMIEPQFFTQLRTEKQLGYVVFAYPRPTFEQAGLAFTIQSPVASADALEKHIDDFITTFSSTLNHLNTEEFESAKAILISELQQKPENLMSAAGLYWSDILTTGKTASSRLAIADAVKNIEQKSFVQRMQTMLKNGKRMIIKGNPSP